MKITESTIDPSRTDPALQSIIPAFRTSYCHPAVMAAWQALGVDVQTTGDVSALARSMGMRTDNPKLVVSAFYNTRGDTVYRLIPSSYEKASHDELHEAQYGAIDEPTRAVAAEMDADEMRELASLCRTVTEAASEQTEGRALFAGLASLPMPDDHMMVCHAARLLREHRGDGHIATLIAEGLSGIDALVVHAAMLPGLADMLRRSRFWTVDEWAVSKDSVRRRGWITDDEDPTFTDEGRAARQAIEDRTDLLAAVPFEAIGADGLERMIVLGEKYSAVSEAAGLGNALPMTPNMAPE